MINELILKEIFDQNKHWKGDEAFFDDGKYQRKLFFEVVDYLKEKQILSIVGLRRTGKTILLKQIIRHLMDNHVKPENIFFLSFDEALVTSKMTLKDYLDAYLENISKNSKDKKYIFIDEIQYIDKWQHILKRYYDREGNIKFIVSGSSSIFLRKKTTESLAGRIYEFKLNPLSFEEFLEMSEVDRQMLNSYKKFAVKAGVKNISYSESECNAFINQYGKTLNKLFISYLLYYQFPANVGQADKNKIKKYLTESIYKKTIEYDIPRLFGVAKIDELKFIYHMFINEVGELVELKTISSEAGIEENTLKRYIYYFQESFLLDLIYNYSKSFRKSKRLQKKSYIASTNFYSAFHDGYSEENSSDNKYLGKLVEAYIFSRLKKNFKYISFYKKGDKEIDFVCSNDYLKKELYSLVEVKYVNAIKEGEFNFLQKIAKDIFKSSGKAIVYTKDFCKLKDDVVMLPAFLVE